jgi:hypothetical protein
MKTCTAHILAQATQERLAERKTSSDFFHNKASVSQRKWVMRKCNNEKNYDHERKNQQHFGFRLKTYIPSLDYLSTAKKERL